MKIFIAYNEHFNTLMLTTKNSTIEEKIEQNGITILKNNNEVIGINISKPDLKLKTGMYSENIEVQNYLKEKIQNILPELNFEKQFVVGEIVESVCISGTHLNICKVNIGVEVLQIVCGAKNARVGLQTIVATPGSWMPNGNQIAQGKLMGVDSFGMLCSAKELGIVDKYFNDEGIAELSKEIYSIGNSFWGDYLNNAK